MSHNPPTGTGKLARLLTLLGMLSLTGLPVAADTIIRTTSYEYDTAGLMTKEVIEPNLANSCLQSTYTHDSFGNRTGASSSTCAGAVAPAINSATVARTKADSYGTDGRFPVTSTNALNQSETKLYDARFGTLTSLTGPNALATTWLYDSFGRKTRENRADNTFTTWTYKLCTDAGANCPATVGPASVIWVSTEQSFAVNLAVNSPEKRQYFDTLNRVVRTQTQGFDGTVAAPTLVQDVEYTNLGQVKHQSNWYALPGGTPVWTEYTYDVQGRTLTESRPDTVAVGGIATTTWAYNALSVTVTNANGQTKTTTKNAQGQVALVTDAQSSTIAYSYDAQGNLLSTHAAGSVTSMGYDLRGNKTTMLDPAMGSWTYSYNAYGELVAQRDSLNQSVTMVYDLLGRMTQRTEPDLVSDWSYDKKFDTTACGKGIGKLCEAKSDNGYNRKHTYDSLGRPSNTATVLDNAGAPATVSETFDANTGRVATKTWPTSYQASYAYTPLGYLKTVTGGGTNGFTQTVSHTVLAMNAQGQITQYKTGNLVTTVKSFDANTNRLMGQTATLDGQGTGNVLNHSYTYDALGNLKTRADNTAGIGTQEGFSYDSLNRLDLAQLVGGAVSPTATIQVIYDARGNIAYKSDVGYYTYDTDRPNRMTNVTLTQPASWSASTAVTHANTGTRVLAYAFDDYRAGAQTVNSVTVGNGNLEYTVTHDTVNARHTVRGESYTSYNMPNVITYGNFITNTTSTQDRTLSFIYGPEHQRIRQAVALTGSGTSAYFAGSTWYLNGEDSLGLSYEKEIRANGTTEHKHYVRSGDTVFALFTSRTGTLNGLPATSTSYLAQDHLGSIAAITSETGTVTERLAYDPWGKRRFITSTPGMPDNLDAIVGVKTDRGYTEHEHLDEIGVVHMNGRIYDPLIGRFMSADPIIQDPYNLKSFNRYSYVWNNPLTETDPSGFELGKHGEGAPGCGCSDGHSTYDNGRPTSGGPSAGYGGRESAPSLVSNNDLPSRVAQERADRSATVDERDSKRISHLYYESRTLDQAKKIDDFQARYPLLAMIVEGINKYGWFKQQPATNIGAASAKQAAALAKHLGYSQKYGAAGIKELENGRFRYYGEVEPVTKAGEMAGRRYVHEYDAVKGTSRGWHETIDHSGNVRQVRPELNNGAKQHYKFDSGGGYTGSW